MRYWTDFDNVLFSPQLLDLYFPTIVFIFREGSTKVPQILDQIFSIFERISFWLILVFLLETLAIENHQYLENEEYCFRQNLICFSYVSEDEFSTIKQKQT